MCVGDKRPVTNSLREYVCIWAPIVKKTDVQIRMINCVDLSLSILTSAARFRRHVTLSLAGLILFGLRGNRRTSQHARKERKYMSPDADGAANQFLLIWARTVANERATETDTVRKREREHGELGHCLAESPVISGSWTCRDVQMCVGRAGDLGSILSLSALLEGSPRGERVPSGPPYTPNTSIHSPHTSSHTFLTYSHYWPVHLPFPPCLRFNSTSADISLYLSKKRPTRDLCCCTARW